METNYDPVYYCTKCLGIGIITDKNGNLKCKDCGATAEKLDVTTFQRWQELYDEKYGHPYLEFPSAIEDDIKEIFSEYEPDIYDDDDYLCQTIIVRDVVNCRIKGEDYRTAEQVVADYIAKNNEEI